MLIFIPGCFFEGLIPPTLLLLPTTDTFCQWLICVISQLHAILLLSRLIHTVNQSEEQANLIRNYFFKIIKKKK